MKERFRESAGGLVFIGAGLLYMAWIADKTRIIQDIWIMLAEGGPWPWPDLTWEWWFIFPIISIVGVVWGWSVGFVATIAFIIYPEWRISKWAARSK